MLMNSVKWKKKDFVELERQSESKKIREGCSCMRLQPSFEIIFCLFLKNIINLILT